MRARTKRAVTEPPAPGELPHAALFTALRNNTEVCKCFLPCENIDFCQREPRAQAHETQMTKQRLLLLSCRQLPGSLNADGSMQEMLLELSPEGRAGWAPSLLPLAA